MIEFRWLRANKTVNGQPAPKLQYRILFAPYKAAHGDIVLYVVDDPQWQDVPEVILNATLSEGERG